MQCTIIARPQFVVARRVQTRSVVVKAAPQVGINAHNGHHCVLYSLSARVLALCDRELGTGRERMVPSLLLSERAYRLS